MRTVATTVILASPWLALFAGLAVVGGSLPGWYLLALAAAVVVACMVLAGLARGMSTHDRWDCPDFVEDEL